MRRTFTTILFSLSLSLSFAQATARAQGSPLPERTPLPLSGSVSGTVRLRDCNAGPENLRIVAGGRSVHPRPLEDNPFVWTYTLTGLAPGTYRVTPVFDAGWCRGGLWAATSSRVTIETRLSSVRGVNFSFTGRRVVTRIPALFLAAAMQDTFDGASLHLDNYTPRSHAVRGRDSWHAADASSFSLPADLGGPLNFNISETSNGRFHYYLRDLDAPRVLVRVGEGGLRLIFPFESDGPAEFKGHCSTTTAPIDLPCPAGPDSTAPDFQINDARLEVLLPLVADGSGSITYGPVRATFEATVEGNGLGGFAEDAVKAGLKSRLEQTVKEKFDEPDPTLPDPHVTVARAFRRELDGLGLGRVVAARFDRGDLIIESYPRS